MVLLCKKQMLKLVSREQIVSYKRTKSKCNSLIKKAKKNLFKEATKSGIMTSKKLWHTVKLFLTNNSCISNGLIGIENNGNLINNEQELVELFNDPLAKFVRCISR